jgi:hypothetical protein
MDKTRLKSLIKEVLSTPPKEKCGCGCGCGDSDNEGVTLNESLVKKDILSENLRYHVDKQLPLTENTFRYGSESFLNLWAEARSLYLREIIHVNEDDKQILEETDLGNFGLYEGVKVPLDLLMLEEVLLTENNIAELEKIKKEIEALKPSLSWIDSVTFSSYSGDLDIRLDYELDPQEIKQLSQLASKYNMNLVYKTGKNATLVKRRVPPKNEELNEINLSSVGVRDLIRRVSQDDKLLDFLNFDTAKDFITFIQHGSLEDYYEIENEINQYDSQLNEAEYHGRKVTLGKPMQGDIKKSKVYVKNAKGKVVKVNFGFGGKSAKGKRMSIKAKNPKRRSAYRARHHCDNPGPRWKANYWSCKAW